jgi:hypothetical protein
MQFNIVILGKICFIFIFMWIIYLCRQSEVIARDSRRMKHIFVVKKGSLAIWKRLDPDGHVPKLSKHDFDQIENEKSLILIFFTKK